MGGGCGRDGRVPTARVHCQARARALCASLLVCERVRGEAVVRGRTPAHEASTRPLNCRVKSKTRWSTHRTTACTCRLGAGARSPRAHTESERLPSGGRVTLCEVCSVTIFIKYRVCSIDKLV